jgi:hypothetical protein
MKYVSPPKYQYLECKNRSANTIRGATALTYPNIDIEELQSTSMKMNRRPAIRSGAPRVSLAA